MRVVLVKGLSASLLILVFFLVLFAILINTLRLTGPLGESYTSEIEYQVGQIVGRKVDIGSLEFTMQGFTPTARITELSIYHEDGVSPALEFDEMEITLDTFRTIANIQLTPTKIVLRGSSVEVTRTTDGKLKLSGFALEQKEQPGTDENLFDILNNLTFEAEDIQVFWNDEPLSLSYKFVAKNLNIKKDASSVAMRGVVALPETIGSDVDIAVKIDGNVEDYRNWNGQFYVKTADIQIPNLPLLAMMDAPLVVSSGLVGVEAWGNWVNGELRVSGDIGLVETVFMQKSSALQEQFYATRINNLESRFTLDIVENLWLLKADHINAVISGDISLLNSLTLELNLNNDDTLYRGALDTLGVATIVDMAKVLSTDGTSSNKILDMIKPAGMVKNLAFSIRPEKNQELRQKTKHLKYTAAADILDFSTTSTDRYPGINSVDASITLSSEGGSALLSSKKLSFEYPRLFSQSMGFDHFRSSLEWQTHSGYVDVVAKELMVSNAEGKADGFGVMRFSRGDPGFMDLEMNSEKLLLRNMTSYLPNNLPVQADKWLRSAFSGGEAENISFSYRGSLAKTAYKAGEAELTAEFSVNSLGIHYQDDWPDVADAAGLVKFSGKGMTVSLTDGSSFDNSVEQGHLSIADFYHPVLNIKLQTRGKTRGGLTYLEQSPPGRKIKSFLRSVEAKGKTKLELSLSFPLNQEVPARRSIVGIVSIEENDLVLTDNDLSLEAVSGKVRFTEEDYNGDKIQALFRGIPVEIDIETDPGELVTVRTKGRLSLKQLLPESQLLQEIIKGESLWNSIVKIPLGRTENQTASSQLAIQLSSDLVGSTIDLPPPLEKQKSLPQPIRVGIISDRGKQDVTFNLNQFFTGHLELIDNKNENQLSRAAFHFGEKQLPLPDKNISVTGDIKLFDLGAWISRFPELHFDEDRGNNTSLVNVDVNVEAITFANQFFNSSRVMVANTNSFWRINVEGDEIEGFIRIPHDLANNFMLSADFERLSLSPNGKENPVTSSSPETGGIVKPSKIPAIDAQVETFTWDEKVLGKAVLKTSVNVVGQVLEKLTLEGDTYDIDVTGYWYETADGGQLTALDYRLSGSELGKLFSDLNISNSLSETEGDISGEISWSGMPVPIDFPSLKGVVNASLQNGRFTQIQSGGFSRFFSVLNLDSLPKNLNRSFKDVSGKGLFFDTFNVDAEIVNGNVFLGNATVESASSKLTFNGSTDLVNKQHALSLGVVPKLSSSVPIAAGLVAGPQTAALVYLLDKIATQAGLDINRTVTLPYEIKGDWEDPEIIELFASNDDENSKELPDH